MKILTASLLLFVINALQLAKERCALKTTSVQNWNYVARAHKGLGDIAKADKAAARAQSLMAG
ncbi:hypothetical protein [uncultured Kiloniella sp.]|uniref:hypothetical protein n=1 Tax=uncultured Kiloniella sp. TaxID=1133091 RepID=UPI002621C0DA|nr:hypothetical protein [uncultured Kiloniella sp.]